MSSSASEAPAAGDTTAGRRWLAAMPPAVARQRDMCTALLDLIEQEPALRWFELGCSLGRGAGDELSDVDCAVGVADDRWPDALDLGDRLSRACGPVADQMRQVHPGRDGESSWHVFTLYDDGSQLSLVLMPASWRAGLPPGSVALYDADGQLAQPIRPPAADADVATMREWAALGWIALGDVAKYLDRRSLWEAHQRLDQARGEVFKLWAAGSTIDFPLYGLTAILDTDGAEMPPGIDATIARLDATDLRRAALECAELLRASTDRVSPALAADGVDPPDGLRNWVMERLSTRSGRRAPGSS